MDYYRQRGSAPFVDILVAEKEIAEQGNGQRPVELIGTINMDRVARNNIQRNVTPIFSDHDQLSSFEANRELHHAAAVS